jgi:hypothetical protein
MLYFNMYQSETKIGEASSVGGERRRFCLQFVVERLNCSTTFSSTINLNKPILTYNLRSVFIILTQRDALNRLVIQLAL